MARLEYLSKSDLRTQDQDMLARDINIVRLLAHSPGMARHLLETALYVRNHSPLDARLREMAIIQVGYAMHSAYEYTHHIELAHEFGVSDEDIRAIADATAGRPTPLPALDKAVLQAARDVAEIWIVLMCHNIVRAATYAQHQHRTTLPSSSRAIFL